VANPTDHLATVRAALDLAGKATPGPWRTGTDALDPAEAMDHEVLARIDGRECYLTRFSITTRGRANATAIVALRNAAPAISALADECERLRDRIATLEAELARPQRRGRRPDRGTARGAARTDAGDGGAVRQGQGVTMLTDDERKTIEAAARALADEADNKRRTIHAAVFGHGRPDALDDLATKLRAIASPRTAPPPTSDASTAIERAATWIELGELGGTPDAVALVATLRDFVRTPRVATVARPIDEWHEDHGDMLWWRFPVNEPPYSGSPLDDDWPGYHTHWTPIVCPDAPSTRGPIGEG
jgi:hypothetical protein